jgi:membrane protein YdbS with pleckstrin-like domain
MFSDSDEHVYLDERRHGIVLLRPLSRAAALAGVGCVGLALGWPASLPGAVLLMIAAALAVAAVWRWDRTHVVVTGDKLVVVHGLVRRRAAAVRLAKVATIEIEQSLLGRLLGYGTVVAGELEIRCVPRPSELCGLVQRLAG